MGGQVLELESERLLRIGKAEGKAEGELVLGQLITKLFADGRTADAEGAEMPAAAAKIYELRTKAHLFIKGDGLQPVAAGIGVPGRFQLQGACGCPQLFQACPVVII